MTVQSYIIGGGLKADVEKYIGDYESLTFIDSFYSNATNPWFYEATIQGFIYSNLVRQFDLAAKNKEYLFFLEQPYLRSNADNRADILFVNIQSEEISAIELKNNFDFSTFYLDMVVLANHLENGNIAFGYGIFFAKNQTEINDTVQTLKADKKLKPLFNQKKLFAVGIIGNPN